MAHAAPVDPTPRTASVFSTDPEPAAFDAAGAARYLGVGKTTLFAEIKDGRLPARKAGRRTLILRGDLDAWLAKLPVRAA